MHHWQWQYSDRCRWWRGQQTQGSVEEQACGCYVSDASVGLYFKFSAVNPKQNGN